MSDIIKSGKELKRTGKNIAASGDFFCPKRRLRKYIKRYISEIQHLEKKFRVELAIYVAY